MKSCHRSSGTRSDLVAAASGSDPGSSPSVCRQDGSALGGPTPVFPLIRLRKARSLLFSLIKSDNIWPAMERGFNVAGVAAGVILAILTICFMCSHFHRSCCSARRPRSPTSRVFKTTFMKISRAAARTNDEKPLFSKEAYLPFHLIVMSHFKERARLGQHCPVSISFEFKGRV